MENLHLQKIQLGNNHELLDALYCPCTINDALGLEEFLKLPVNDEYRENQLNKRESELSTTRLGTAGEKLYDIEIISNNNYIDVSKSDSATDK
jgi:hypothetical protein